jgi:hypothetical protein
MSATRAAASLVTGELSCTEICGVPDDRVTVLAKEIHQHHASTMPAPRRYPDELRERAVREVRATGRAVRDHHHRPATHLPGRRPGRRPLLGKLLAHPLKNLLGDGEFVALGPDLRQLLGQLFFEFVQFRTPRGDPFQKLGSVHRIVEGRPPAASRNRQAAR